MITRPRIAVFIDGANLYATTRTLGFQMDFSKLRDLFEKKGELLRIYYYTALLEEIDGNIKLQGMVDWLSYNGYLVVTKVAKEYHNGGDKPRVKGNMDVEFTLDVYKLVNTGKVDHIYLFTGDGDFRRLVEEVQNFGVKVTIVSSLVTAPPMVADILRKQVDAFLELGTLKELLEKR